MPAGLQRWEVNGMSSVYGLVGLLILLMGLLVIAASAPVLRYTERNTAASSQFSPVMLTWLARALGAILFMLGFVTLLNG